MRFSKKKKLNCMDHKMQLAMTDSLKTAGCPSRVDVLISEGHIEIRESASSHGIFLCNLA